MKRKISSICIVVLIVSIFMTCLAPAFASDGITPRYKAIAQIASSLSISSSGGATCAGRVVLDDGYTADLVVELKQDWTTIKTWTSSGSLVVSAGGLYYVMSGHTYVVRTTATVYNSNGKLVEIVAKNSLESTY